MEETKDGLRGVGFIFTPALRSLWFRLVRTVCSYNDFWDNMLFFNGFWIAREYVVLSIPFHSQYKTSSKSKNEKQFLKRPPCAVPHLGSVDEDVPKTKAKREKRREDDKRQTSWVGIQRRQVDD